MRCRKQAGINAGFGVWACKAREGAKQITNTNTEGDGEKFVTRKPLFFSEHGFQKHCFLRCSGIFSGLKLLLIPLPGTLFVSYVFLLHMPCRSTGPHQKQTRRLQRNSVDRTKHRIDIYSFPNFLLQFFLKKPNLVSLSPILVPHLFFQTLFFSVFAGYSGPLCLKPPGSGLPHNPALPDPPRLSYPSGGVRKSMTKKDIHPRGFGENSVTPLLHGLRLYPRTPPHPKSKILTPNLSLGFWTLQIFGKFCTVLAPT